jgi:hypothetical protein
LIVGSKNGFRFTKWQGARVPKWWNLKDGPPQHSCLLLNCESLHLLKCYWNPLFEKMVKIKAEFMKFSNFHWCYKIKVILAIWFPTMQMAINHSIGSVIYVTHPCFGDIAPFYFNMFQKNSNNLKMTQCEIRLVLKTLIQRF